MTTLKVGKYLIKASIDRWVYNPLNRFVRRKNVVNVSRSLMYILVAILSPIWFPIIQKLTRFESLEYIEWLLIILMLIAPILVLYWCERQDKKARIDELVEVLKKSGIAKDTEK